MGISAVGRWRGVKPFALRLICNGFAVLGLALGGGCDAVLQDPAHISRSAKRPAPRDGSLRETPARPNILLITLDTLRYDQTGICAGSTNQTPFLQTLARNGVEFTNNYSTYDSTPESHFSMMTGYGKVGVGGYRRDDSVVGHLARVGYETFGIAANGNLSQTNNPFLSGFQRYICLYDVWEAMSPAQKIATSVEIDSLIRSYGSPVNDFNRSKVYASADRVLGRFEQEVSQVREPFFGFLNLIDAHDPYFPDRGRYDADTLEKDIRPSNFASDLRTRPLPPDMTNPDLVRDEKRRNLIVATLETAQQRKWQATFDLSASALEVYKGRYRALIRQIDDALPRVFDILASRKLLESTVVIITSDHGESLGELHLITHSFHNRGDHEATHRVPLIIVLPARYHSVARSQRILTTSADLAPTIYDLAGIDWHPISERVPPGLYGQSLYPYLSAKRIAYSRNGAADSAPAGTGERSTERESAERRLRALGYLR
jgi:arylsulfatase A-like enzyme